MIPRAHITDWRSQAPWPTDAQVEQDLVLTRALTEIFIRSAVANAVAFRGGTALHKLYLERPGRYSEDIDLVQIESRSHRKCAGRDSRLPRSLAGRTSTKAGTRACNHNLQVQHHV